MRKSRPTKLFRAGLDATRNSLAAFREEQGNTMSTETCPTSAPFFGFMGVTSALVFANIGAAYGTAKSGVGIASMGVMNPGLVMRNIIPVVMAGVLGIYGLIVAVILQGSISKPEEANGAFTTKFSSFSGYAYPLGGPLLRFIWISGGHGDRRRRRRGRARGRPAGEAVRRHDPHPHLRGGVGIARASSSRSSTPQQSAECDTA